MITKEKIASWVIRAFSGGGVTSFRKIDPRSVYEVIETVRNLMMEEFIAENGYLDGEYITQFPNIDVLNDTTTSQQYSILPSRLISLSNFDGVHQVSPMKNQKESFIKLQNGSQAVYSNLEAGKLAGKTGYYIERVKIGTDKSIRIYYQCLPFAYNKVLIKMVASTYNFDEDEQLPIPAAHEQELMDRVMKAISIQLGIPIDTKNDSEPQ